MMSLREHQSPNKGETDTWLTPKWILDLLPVFDLDPCAAPDPRPWATAKTMWDEAYDGFNRAWHGRVWLNPPFSDKGRWLAKLAQHGNGIALVPCAPEIKPFRESVWPEADALLFLNKRPHFHFPDGQRASFNSGQSIVLVAYGKENAEALMRMKEHGYFMSNEYNRRKAGAP
jgi:hypothetical protein